ncbi:MAG: hypothetical protein DPW18_18915, partial [Chloroflexi bacterium]|nr:hypothetical protein [Chloroflexota bacterium]
MLDEANAAGYVASREPIDLFSTDYRHIDGIQWKIKEVIETITGLKDDASPFAGWVEGKTDTSEKFYTYLKAFCEKTPLVLAFDTFENLDWVASDWLFKGEPDGLQAPGLICIIAGREKEDIEKYRENPLVREIRISGFTFEEVEALYWKITDQFKLNYIDPLEDLLRVAGLSAPISHESEIEWIRKVTNGNPLCLEMVFRWLGTLLGGGSLQGLTPDRFEERLMMEVRELAEREQLDAGAGKRISRPVYDTLLCMAYVTRRFDEDFLRHLIEKKLIGLDDPAVTRQDIISNLERYFFVKVRQGNAGHKVLQLHDEMARLVREYVWPYYDHSGEKKQALLEAVDE